MFEMNQHAQEWQNKPSFREVLEAVCGHPVSEQEADDALYTLTEFFKLLGEIEQEQQEKNQIVEDSLMKEMKKYLNQQILKI